MPKKRVNTPRSSLIHLALDECNGGNVDFSAVNKVVHGGESHDAKEHNDGPVHGGRRGWGGGREEAEDEDGSQVAQGEDIDDDAGAAQIEAAHGEGLTTQAFEEDAANDDHV